MRATILSVIVLVVIFVTLGLPQTSGPAPSGPSGRGSGRGRGADPLDFDDHPGWKQLFDGSSLAGWDGDPTVWKVANGVITGEPIPPPGGGFSQTFLIWKGGELGDFELKLEFKLDGARADSGIQYRGYLAPPALVTGRGAGRGSGPVQVPVLAPAPPSRPWTPEKVQWNLGGGYQFDLNGSGNGQVVDVGTNDPAVPGGGSRGIIAFRGQVVRAEADRRPRTIGILGTADDLAALIHNDDWNQVDLIARGNTFTHMINGHVMSIFIDEDPAKFKPRGILGLQCSGPAGVKISFRNVWLRGS